VAAADGRDHLLLQFCADLRLLWTQADGPSLRVLGAQVGLGKSQLGAILGGQVRRPPDWDTVRKLVDSFRAYAQAHDRWARVSLRTDLDGFWRPRHMMLEHAFRQPRPPRPARRRRGGPVPRQLPAAVGHLAGRTTELATLDRLADRCRDRAAPAVVVTIDGTAGIGKTTVAVSWAHGAATRFTGGQLYADLDGFNPHGQAVDAGEVLHRFLDALGVAPSRMPDDLAARAALYRSLVAGRRVLVVLDNARDAAQVRPLLPGGPGCMALVTSRRRLTGLVTAEGALPIMLDLLTPAEARQLLVRRIGPDRVAAEPDAVDDIIARCARLPLALAIVAAGAATHPESRLAAFAAQLDSVPGALDGLAAADHDTDLRTVFSWSYRALGPPAARLFRLLGLYPGQEVTPAAAASLAGIPVADVQPLLTELVQAQLATEHRAGRYTSHDLLRGYAVELTESHDTTAERQAALLRLLDHLLHTAIAAATLLEPDRQLIDVEPARAGARVGSFATPEEALAWCTTEQPTLLAAVRRSGDAGSDRHTWQLAWACDPMLQRRGRRQEWATMHQLALVAAERLDDPLARAHAHRGIGRACAGMDRLDDSRVHYRAALDLFTRAGDRVHQAYTYLNLSVVDERQGRQGMALRHTRRAYALFRRAGHHSGQARALNGLGWQYALLGEYDQALASCRRALVLLKQAGDRGGQAHTWDSLGFAHHHLGQYRQAAACYQRALRLIRGLGDRGNEAEILIHLGDTQHAADTPDAARATWQRALEILDQLDHADAEAVRARLDKLL